MTLGYTNEGPFAIVSGEALEAYRLVLLSSDTAKYSDGGEEPIGLTTEPKASGFSVSIQPLQGGIYPVTVSKAISSGVAIYPTTDGKVSDAAVGTQIGITMAAATADGGVIPAIVWGPRGGSDAFASHKSTYEYFDDFYTYNTTFNYAVVEDVGATEADKITDAAGGVLQIGCDGDAEDECYVSSIAEVFKFQTDKTLYFETRVKLTEANTDDANIIIGLSDTVAADSLQDAGAGPMASYDGVVFFKVLDGTVWQFETSNAGTQVTTASAGTFNDATWTTLGFLYDYNDGVTAKVTPFIDGVAGTVLDLVIAGLEEMHLLMGVKAGGANEEALLVDYAHVIAER